MILSLDGTDPAFPFPDPRLAEADGLVAVGGDLSPQRLLQAYRQGIFPWYNEEQPILWWSPDPRMVLFPEAIRISRSMRKFLRLGTLTITEDQDFAGVIRACAEPRPGQAGTWLNEEMIHSYLLLHQQGHAHSIEIWDRDRLVGGLYGIQMGPLFFGESMFSRVSNASKMALIHLAGKFGKHPDALIDCQVHSPHLASLGAILIPRQKFMSIIEKHAK